MMRWVKQNTFFHCCIFIKHNKHDAQIIHIFYPPLPYYLYPLSIFIQTFWTCPLPMTPLWWTINSLQERSHLDFRYHLCERDCWSIDSKITWIQTHMYSFRTYIYLPILSKWSFPSSTLWLRPSSLKNIKMGFQGSDGKYTTKYTKTCQKSFFSTFRLNCNFCTEVQPKPSKLFQETLVEMKQHNPVAWIT